MEDNYHKPEAFQGSEEDMVVLAAHNRTQSDAKDEGLADPIESRRVHVDETPDYNH